MNFVVLYKGNQGNAGDRVRLLRQASESRGINFRAIDVETHDWSAPKPVSAGDLMYAATLGTETLESMCLLPGVVTFYRNNPELNTFRSTNEWSIAHERAALPCPRTVFAVTSEPIRLRRYVDAVGGFPVVVKIYGGTSGIGAMRIDSMPSLLSIVEYIESKGDRFILREYVEPAEILRAVVLGDRVIHCVAKKIPQDDFRSRVFSPADVSVRDCHAEAESLAVMASRVVNLEFTGVDILVDVAGRSLLLEVNMPHNFSVLQDWLDVDLAGMALEHLVKKAAGRVPLESTTH